MSPAPKPPQVIAIVGATATGKTALGEAVAGALGAEVVCADSRQVFRELEIGTGKPTPSERAGQPHHLFEALSLGERATAGWYAHAAREVCAALHAQGRLPLLVGGSGLYLKAARSGLAPAPSEAPEVRARLHAELEASGSEALHERLRRVDPETAARLEPRDAQRITRALEVWEVGRRPLSWWHRQPRTPAVAGEWRIVELVVPPTVLRDRIVRRARWMFEHGLVEETRDLLAQGLGGPLRRLRAVGYDEAADLLEGRIDRAEAVSRASLRTAQLAKRQRTWFRHQPDPRRIEAGAADAAVLLDRVLAVLRA